MVRYEDNHLVIDIDLGQWDTPKESRAQLMNALLTVIPALDRDSLSSNGTEVWWLCELVRALSEEG